MVPDSDQVVIKRAVNEVQARTRKWWLRHPGCTRHIAVVDKAEYNTTSAESEFCCGKIKEIAGKLVTIGILICEGKTVKKRAWRLLEENPIQVDTTEGTTWVMRYIDWELPTEAYMQSIQSAIIASTGMADADLAKLLKVKIEDIKKWYSGLSPIPNKVIKEIVTRFVNN